MSHTILPKLQLLPILLRSLIVSSLLSQMSLSLMAPKSSLQGTFQIEVSSSTDLDCRDANREACSCFLFPLIDELKQPRDGTGDYTQSLKGVIAANHSVRFAWMRQTERQNRGRVNKKDGDTSKRTLSKKTPREKKKYFVSIDVSV